MEKLQILVGLLLPAPRVIARTKVGDCAFLEQLARNIHNGKIFHTFKMLLETFFKLAFYQIQKIFCKFLIMYI